MPHPIPEPARKVIQFFTVLAVLLILAAIAIPNWMALDTRNRVRATRANMHTVQLCAEDFCAAHAGIYASTIEGAPWRTDSALLMHMPRKLLLKNPFTGKLTEPRLGPEAGATPPGSVWYTPIPDSTGKITKYLITGYGPEGKLRLTLFSEENGRTWN